MNLIWKNHAHFHIKKEFAYLGLVILWIALTCGEIIWGVLPNWFWIRPISQAKILLIAAIFTGRNLCFSHYRYPQTFGMVFSAILALWITLNFFGKQNINFWQGNILIILDGVIWSISAALVGEVIMAIFKYWNSFNLVVPADLSQLQKNNHRVTNLLGIWLTLIFGSVYYYLINCYLLDVIWHSRFLASLLCFFGLTLQGIYIFRRRNLIDQELANIDSKLQAYLNWRIEPEGEQLIFFEKFCWLLAVRSYWQSFQRQQFPLGCLLLYGFLAMVLMALPYIFKVVIEV